MRHIDHQQCADGMGDVGKTLKVDYARICACAVSYTHLDVYKRQILYTVDLACRIFAGYHLKEYSTLDALKTNKIPILFVHGDADRFVPVEMTYENYNACTCLLYTSFGLYPVCSSSRFTTLSKSSKYASLLA